jgi:hypothetical protein
MLTLVTEKILFDGDSNELSLNKLKYVNEEAEDFTATSKKRRTFIGLFRGGTPPLPGELAPTTVTPPTQGTTMSSTTTTMTRVTTMMMTNSPTTPSIS